MNNSSLDFNQTEIQMIVFRLANEEYAVPITCVQEIIVTQKTTHIPKSPKFVEGIINLRGKIIPIIDGKKKFNLESNSGMGVQDSRVIVLDVNSEIIGLIVDEVSEVIHLNTKDIEKSPIETEDDSDFIMGVGKFQDKLLIILDPQKFLTHAETSALKSLSNITDAIQQVKQTAEV